MALSDNCQYKRIKTVKLCIADLKSLVEIQTRALIEAGLDDAQPVELFATIRVKWCAVETIGAGVARFGAITILDDATHIFWCMWDADFPDLETRNHWILNDGKRYKILKVHNINERNTTIAIQTTERGDSTLEASEA